MEWVALPINENDVDSTETKLIQKMKLLKRMLKEAYRFSSPRKDIEEILIAKDVKLFVISNWLNLDRRVRRMISFKRGLKKYG